MNLQPRIDVAERFTNGLQPILFVLREYGYKQHSKNFTITLLFLIQYVKWAKEFPFHYSQKFPTDDEIVQRYAQIIKERDSKTGGKPLTDC